MKTLVVLALGAALTTRLCAGTYVFTPQSSDGTVTALNSIDTVSAATGRVGSTTSSGFGRASVFVFSVPKIPFGEHFSSATLQLNLASKAGTGFTFNGDLTSLGFSASPAITGTDFYAGVYGSAPSSTLLQQHFLTPSTATGTVAANTVGNAAITADLNNALAAGIGQGSFYFLRLNPDTASVTNADLGYNVSMAEDASAHQPSLSVQTATAPQLGRVLFEYWTGLDSNASVTDLTNTTLNPNYPNQPTGREYPTVLEIPPNMDSSSGDRMRCWFYAPTTGAYTFAIASDDNSVLLFSTDANPADATQIASVTGSTGYQNWTTFSSQKSAVINLTAGQQCYMESLHKQGTGSSNLSIGWQPPGASSIALMPATNCAPYDANVAYSTGAVASLTRPLIHPRLMISPAAISRMVNEVTLGNAQYNATLAANWTTIKNVVTSSVNSSTPSGGNTLVGPLIGSAVIVTGIGTTQTNLIPAARSLQDRVYYLSFFYLMESRLNPSDTNIQKALDQIYTELQSAANWGSTVTNPAAGTLTGKWDRYQFLDLPEVSHAFAIAYDWDYAGWTSAQKSFIVDAISREGLGESDGGNGQNNGNSQLSAGYFTGTGNWPIVCNGGVLVSAIAVLGDESTYLPGSPNPTDTAQATKVLDTAMPPLPTSTSMTEWAPDGGWDEGSAYWAFADRYLSTLYASLETSCGTCFKMDQQSGMASIGAFFLYGTGPSNNCFNFSDANSGTYNGPWTQYLGLKYNLPIYSSPENTSGHYPTDLLWFDSRVVKPDSTIPLSTYFQPAGAIMLRNSWTSSTALFVGLKAGFNAGVTPYGSGHEDLELGEFVLDALGIRWAMDMGTDNYSLPGYFTTSPTSTNNRWLYYRKRAEGNNTLVINPSTDGGQWVNAKSSILDFETTPTLQQSIIDLTQAYNETNGAPSTTTVSNGTAAAATATSVPVSSLHRGVRILNGVAQLQDEITTGNISAGVLTSGPNVWQYQTMTAQTGTFTVTFDATPSATPTNSIIGLSNGVQTAYTGFACIARFNPTGDIDVRDGATYDAATLIPYAANTKYHFRMAVNVATHTYSLYVTPPGGSELTVGLNVAFRSEQSAVSNLNYMTCYEDPAGSGTLTVANFTVNNQTQAPTVDLNWFMHTNTSVNITNGTTPPTATLTSGTKHLLLTLQSPAGAIFKEMAATPLPGSPVGTGQATNSGVNKLWIELPVSGTTTLTVAFSPYLTGATPPAPPPVIPFSSWTATGAAPTPSVTQWASNYFTATQLADPTISGPTAKPMSDDTTNLLKYLCDVNPSGTMTSADQAALPKMTLTTNNGVHYLTLNYRQNPLAAGVSVGVLTSPDLLNWTTTTPASIQQVSTDAATGDPMMQLLVQVPTGTAKEFIRLNLTQP